MCVRGRTLVLNGSDDTQLLQRVLVRTEHFSLEDRSTMAKSPFLLCQRWLNNSFQFNLYPTNITSPTTSYTRPSLAVFPTSNISDVRSCDFPRFNHRHVHFSPFRETDILRMHEPGLRTRSRIHSHLL
ncbi:unnamed protein product [Ectocarpus sp. 4 AP-2014]